MPVYTYQCKECNITIDEFMKIDERDDLCKIANKHCPIRKKRWDNIIKKAKDSHEINACEFISDYGEKGLQYGDCKLERIQVSGSFKI